ncbi:MAG: DNA polymerase III subunit alpha [candidate division Zixibacteria bacterium]|nr:DNA polymerase III subunit alpha [candidate division Zixibacteria bacterium]
MKFANFVHLHTHSQYSLLDGACRLDAAIEMAREYKMPALAITDHGNLFGAAEFYKKAIKAGVKPIIGTEAYVAGGSRFDKKPSSVYPDGGFHLVLLAKNRIGYQNLLKLSTAGYLEGFYHRPRIDKALLKQYSEGLIATSACMKGEVNWNLLKGDTEAAVASARELAEIFGEGNFYLEIQDHGIEKEKWLIPRVDAISRETGIPLVVTNDCHYLKQEHAEAHDCLLCIQTGKLVEDTNRMKYNSDQIYFKSPQEMEYQFGDFKTALENTVHIAESCNVELEFGKLLLPIFPIPRPFVDADEFLKNLSQEGLAKRYEKITPKIQERLDYELSVIKQMGYAGYFLIVKDFCDYARSQKISVGPGRGSAAGSLVSYVLRITNMDPIHFDLLFERFLNPERISMPDIDIDFADRGRDKIIEYVIAKYGADNVCQIITFGTMMARGVLRDVGRVLSIPYGEVDRITKMIPDIPGISLQDAISKVPELAELQKKDKRIEKLIRFSLILEGSARHASTHAAGVVIAPSALTNYVPLFKGSRDEITTQFDMKMVEEVGLLKMDFLGLRTLTVLEDALAMIAQDFPDRPIDLDTIPLDDAEVYKLFARGETIGIFQFESSGMRDYLRRLEPENFDDITAMNALYRPGPLDYEGPKGANMIDIYIERKKGAANIVHLHPKLEQILGATYGVIVFQEQVLSIANQLAGYSMGRADTLRKAMGKKDAALMAAQKAEFLAGAEAHKVDRKVADEVFNRIETFARYGFNKAHSTCYAFIAYQTAWLKTKYPAHYMAALLTSEMQDSDRIYVLLEECRRMGISVLPPDVNESLFDFSVAEGTIRFGLQAVKNVGEGPARSIMTERKTKGQFTSLADMAGRIPSKMINRRTLESLIAGGACDSLQGSRAQKFAAVERILEFGQKAFEKANSHDLFALSGGAVERTAPEYEQIDEWPTSIRLAKEKEMLGFYISGHPLDRFKDELRLFTTCATEGLAKIPDGREVTVGGIISSVKKKLDKKGNAMAFATLEDFSGNVELILFSDCYEKGKDCIEVERMVLVTGRVSTREGEYPKIVGTEIVALEKLAERFKCQLVIKISADCSDSTLEKTLASLSEYKGTAPVLVAARENGSEVYIRAKKYSVTLDFELLNRLKEILGGSSAYLRPIPDNMSEPAERNK